MKKKLLFGFMAVMLVAGTILTGCAKPAVPEKVYELTYCSHQPNTSGFALMIQDYFAELEKRTNGAVKVTNWGFLQSIVKAGEQQEATSKGICDAAFAPPGYAPAEIPLTFLASYPYLPGTDPAVCALALTELYETWEPLQKEFHKQNLELLFFSPAAPMLIATNKEISKPEDLTTLKLRGYGAVSEAFTRVGISAVSMSSAEVYEAMSRGTINGSSAPMEWIRSAKLTEVTKQLIDVGIGTFGANAYVMNKTLYDSFPEWIQDEIKKLRWGGPNISEPIAMGVKRFTEAENLTITELEKLKVKKYKFTPEEEKWFKDRVKPEELWAAYIEKNQNVEGINEFLDLWFPLLKKYEGAIPYEDAFERWHAPE